jgi:hypothetical protein
MWRVPFEIEGIGQQRDFEELRMGEGRYSAIFVFKKLDFMLMLFGCFTCFKRAQIAPFAGLRIFFL